MLYAELFLYWSCIVLLEPTEDVDTINVRRGASTGSNKEFEHCSIQDIAQKLTEKGKFMFYIFYHHIRL